jgi:hypothetical protein
MGWGQKRAVPQPATPAVREEPPEEVASHDPEPKEKQTDAAKEQLAWHEMKSRKGWTDATLLMLLYEFISSKQLFGELVKFTRRR